MELQIGSTVGDYEIVGLLGAGGMGQVYKVRNTISGRVEAMKVLLPDLSGSYELAERFQREISLLGALDHPNIVQLRTAYRSGDRILMVMEFVDGLTFEQKLKDGPLPVPEALSAICQVLAALEFAHASGVIHRDIKPANMIATGAGVVKLMDFGIAKAATNYKLTMTGTTMGSLYYMSPEQIQGSATLDGRADLYSVGVTLYQFVTGRRPFDGDSQYAIMAAHLESAPLPPVLLDPRLPRALNDVILMSVAKDPANRFQSAGAFRKALEEIAAAIQAPEPAAFAVPPQVQAGPPAPPPPPVLVASAPALAPKSTRGLWMALGGVAVAALLVGIVEVGPWKGARAGSNGQQGAAAKPGQPPPAASQTPSEPASASQRDQLPAPASAQPASPQPPARLQPAPNPSVSAPPAQVSAPRPTAPKPSVSALPAQSSAPRQPAPATPVNSRELKEARDQSILLGGRAAAVRASVDSLRAEVAAQGLALRPDLQEAYTLVDAYLKSADAALAAADAEGAKEALAKAAVQVEKLEKIMGRSRN